MMSVKIELKLQIWVLAIYGPAGLTVSTHASDEELKEHLLVELDQALGGGVNRDLSLSALLRMADDIAVITDGEWVIMVELHNHDIPIWVG